jgi:hypothetical protein
MQTPRDPFKEIWMPLQTIVLLTVAVVAIAFALVLYGLFLADDDPFTDFFDREK